MTMKKHNQGYYKTGRMIQCLLIALTKHLCHSYNKTREFKMNVLNISSCEVLDKAQNTKIWLKNVLTTCYNVELMPKLGNSANWHDFFPVSKYELLCLCNYSYHSQIITTLGDCSQSNDISLKKYIQPLLFLYKDIIILPKQ